MKYKYTHWLKIENDMVEDVWIKLREYKQKYSCNMEVFYRETNFIDKFIKLECNQQYQDLDLDVNSISDNGLRHLSSKPKNIYQYNYKIEEFFKRNIKRENTVDEIINEDNIEEYRDSIESNYEDSLKLILLNILETGYSKLIYNNQVTKSMIDIISNRIAEDEEFNNYIDSLIHAEIVEYIKKNNIENEQEDEEVI